MLIAEPNAMILYLTLAKVGGLSLYDDYNRLDREEALRLWTQGSAYKSSEETVKGALSPGQYADLAVLSSDFMTVADEAIKDIVSVLTIVGGRIVYAAEEFISFDPPLPPPSPDWSPVKYYKSYASSGLHHASCVAHGHDGKLSHWLGLNKPGLKQPNFENPWALGCGCFAY